MAELAEYKKVLVNAVTVTGLGLQTDGVDANCEGSMAHGKMWIRGDVKAQWGAL